MKQNYIDGKGVYHNELNLTLAQIYDSGVEFGCKVTAKDKAEDIITELEKIKADIKDVLSLNNERDMLLPASYICKLVDKHISELKGEQQ